MVTEKLRGFRKRLACAVCNRHVATGLALACVAGAVGFGVLLAWPMDTARYLHVPASAELLARDGQLLCPFLNEDDHWAFERSLSEISPYLVQATIAVEDERFRRHPGVDPIAVGRAALQNLGQRGVVSGASTLTMQVVKQAEPSPRPLRGKVWQALQAMRLECRTSKDDILLAYLNRAPYGLNLLGCEAAARRYFGKPASELTLPEAACLAGLPKAPAVLGPVDHPDEARARRDFVLRRMRDEGYIGGRECAEAMAVPIEARWHEFPALSRHLAMRIAPAIGPGGSVRTTFDARLQCDVERFVTEELERHDGEITNTAVLVVDVPTASVLARVGSADFFNTPGGGQVDACLAPRSPGSALKPFAYALAIEKNLLYSCEALCDGKLDCGLYSPENYDRQHWGLVPAGDALRWSRNVPAVTVLERVGPAAFVENLNAFGLTTLTRSPEHYGLGLVLGNCGVRLEELTQAYCALAARGEYRPLRVLAASTATSARRVLSEGTCESVYRMLEQPLDEGWRQGTVEANDAVPRVCWKTGTSTGLHDAWAFVFNRQYVVGVWMGNNNGRPSLRLVGADAAMPLAGRIFGSLERGPTPAWPGGLSLREVRVCSVSGLPASRWCPNAKTALIPRGQYLHRRCDMHHPVGDGETVAERWPGTAKGWDLARIETPALESVGPSVEAEGARTALRILQPVDDAEFILTGRQNADVLRLHASLDATSTLHWFHDDHYLGESTPESPAQIPLEVGDHSLVCVSDSQPDWEHAVHYRVVPAETALRQR
jgi:penicillin-binding protein 1C